MPKTSYVLTGVGLACAMLGCDKEEIRRYQVPRVEAVERSAMPNRNPSFNRMLAAIVPHGEHTWFFKLAGPAQALDEHKEVFERFVRSVHFDAGGQIAWTAPEGWREQPGTGMRYATFKLGPDDEPLELTVIPLGTVGGARSILENVNGWRGEVGLAPVVKEELDAVTTEVKLESATATLVDFTGPGRAASATSAPLPSARSPSAADTSTSHSNFRFDTPDGWAEQSEPGPFSVLTFEVRHRDGQAKVTVSPLGGGVLENVNRWRGQIGLGSIGADELRQELHPIEVADAEAQYVDLIGPERPGQPARRILGVIAVHHGQTWFFKMMGPTKLLEQQKSNFEQFVRSFKFH